MLRIRSLHLKKRDEGLQLFDAATELVQIVRSTRTDDETRAVRADKQREGSLTYPLWYLIRARTSELLERSPNVRKLTHSRSPSPSPLALILTEMQGG